MDLTLNLRSVSTIKISKNVRCKDCETFLPIGSLGFSCYYSGQQLQHTRIICGCCAIPTKVVKEVKGNNVKKDDTADVVDNLVENAEITKK